MNLTFLIFLLKKITYFDINTLCPYKYLHVVLKEMIIFYNKKIRAFLSKLYIYIYMID